MLDWWILGMNKRNNTYITEFNPKKGIRLANNKIQTKKFLTQRGIPVPQTIAHIKTRQERLYFDFSKITHTTFVIKPNKWSKGSGIFIIKEMRLRKDYQPTQQVQETGEKTFWDRFNIFNQNFDAVYDSWYEFFVGSTWISEQNLKEKCLWIFDGSYSSNNKSDTILLEDRLLPGIGFTEFCEYGLADMRVIIFNLVPMIAMLRMPTKESWGKANLAQGGIWLGLDIITWKINSLYRKWKSYTSEFPPEWQHFKGKTIPYRKEIIQYSANAQYFVNIGYLGMDWVITQKWPKLLEINARSWLEIQNITGKPLLSIMQKIEDLDITTPNKWIEISKSLFSDERISEVKEQHIVYLSQTGKLSYQKNWKKRGLPVTITVGIDKVKSYTSEKVLKRIVWADNISVDLWHHDTILKNINLLSSSQIQWNKIVLWQKSLEHYYIKPIHKSKVSTKMINPETILEDEIVSLKLLDDKINIINKQLNLAQILQPSNYLDEFDTFVSLHGDYNPQFTYNFPTYKDLHHLSDQIKELDIKYRQKEYFDSSFANLFFEKLDEMQTKINLIRAYKKQNFWLIDRYNRVLFGEIDEDLLQRSKDKIKEWISFSAKILWTTLRWNDIIDYIKTYITKKRLEWVRVRRDDTTLSRISVGFWKFATIKIKNTAFFREHKLLSKLVHEIDVHTMRYLNGKKSGRNIFTTGTAGYLETEEWLSVYLANKKLQEIIPWYDGISKYKNYYFVAQASTMSFAELAKKIVDIKKTLSKRKNTVINYKTLFNTTLKFMKGKKDTSIQNTGMIFGKNIVYLNGYEKISKLSLQEPVKLQYLIKCWKIKESDLSFFK
jgi:hypothetical protein